MHQIEIELDVPVPMRDGTVLRADVLYGHLFPDRLDTVADAMDAARTVALTVAAEAGAGRRRDTAAVVPLRL